MIFRIIILLSLLVLISESFLIDDSIREFRQDYRKFRRVSLKVVDRSFFNVYNALNLSLLNATEPLKDIHEKWKKFCKSFKNANCDNSTAQRWLIACKDVNDLITKTFQIREDLMMEFYCGDLTAPTPPALILDTLYYYMEPQFEEMWNVYIKNSSCVAPFLKTYFPSYEPIIDNIIYITNQTAEKMPEIFSQARHLYQFSPSAIYECIRNSGSCLRSKKIDKCAERAVRRFIYKLFLD